MPKRYGLFTCVALIALDLLSKTIVIRSNVFSFLGPFGIGAMIGERDVTAVVSSLPLALKNVALVTCVGFVLGGFLLLGLTLPRSFGKLYLSTSVLIAGIAANVIDGVLNVGVTSVFLIGSAESVRYHFCLADVFTLVGACLVAYCGYRSFPVLFPKRSYKRKYWVNPEFQQRYSFILCAVGLAYALVIGLFSVSFFKALLVITADGKQSVGSDWLAGYLLCFLLITALYIAVMLVFARRLTHAIAGPIHAFERTMRDIIEGKDSSLKLRDTDEFQNLNSLAADLKQAIRKR